MTIIPIQSTGLSDEEQRALSENLTQLTNCHNDNVRRSNFYNTKEILKDFGFSIPPTMTKFETVLGWPAKTVDALSSRLQFEGFVMPGDESINEELQDMFALNRMAVEWPQVQISTFTHGCAFVAVTPGDTDAGEPQALISAMPATEATGIWDVRRRSLKSALWVPDLLAAEVIPKMCVIFLPDHTT